MSSSKKQVRCPRDKLGILLPGMGAVSTTCIAGVLAIRKGMGQAFGSLTQIGRVRLGRESENKNPYIKELVPLANLKDIVFGGWDIFSDNVYEAAIKAKVLDKDLLDQLKPELENIRPMPAVFDSKFVKNLAGNNTKKAETKWDYAEMLQEDIKLFKQENQLDRIVVIWCGSTEAYLDPKKVPQTIDEFEKGLKENHPLISSSMIYAYAAIKLGIPYANGAPNTQFEFPALVDLAKQTKTPVCGKDFKTGQTLMKTIIAPGIKARLLGVNGWFSTNILGNRDGAVLDDLDSFKAKEMSKLSAIDYILRPDYYPELYKDLYHKVQISYYPPRGDNKEGWDNIDIFGWLGYPMQIKLNFLCRDSILAAPLVLDLALFLDLAKRADLSGIQEWLSFYFKDPDTNPGIEPEQDLFIQLRNLEDTLRYLMGE